VAENIMKQYSKNNLKIIFWKLRFSDFFLLKYR
jgi:hypothetical protein